MRLSATFESLRIRNFRLWVVGLLVSATGTWMQATAQDWIVLTELTDHDAAAVGVVIALQLIPNLLILPLAGAMTERFSRRKILLIAQCFSFTLAIILGVLVLTSTVELWHVWILAFLLGCGSAFEGPARTTFISELVSDKHLANGVSLNSVAFNSARLLGPALAGVAIAFVGTGWVFIINAASFVFVAAALLAIRQRELSHAQPPPKGLGTVRAGLRYVAGRPDIIVVMVVSFLLGTFAFNFAVITAAMARIEFEADSAAFGALNSALAVGSIVGALVTAGRSSPTLKLLTVSSFLFAGASVVAAVAPDYVWFAITLPLVGLTSMMIMTTAHTRVQLLTDPPYRSRVMSLYILVLMAGGPIGGPVLGIIANELGPRWSVAVPALAGLASGVVLVVWRRRHPETSALSDRPLRERWRSGADDPSEMEPIS